MAAPRDTLLRHLTLLQLIPRQPARIDTSTLVEKLAERGFKVEQRTIQRDLKDKLSILFPILCDDSELPYRWSFDREAQINLPHLDTPTALALYLAETQLRSLLPQSVADQLGPLFNTAKAYLDNLPNNLLTNWTKRVRTLPNGKALIPAPINDEVWRTVTEALLQGQALQIHYRSRKQGEEKTYLLHPVGMVSRYSISYLVAMVDDYENYRQFALHRILAAETLEQDARTAPNFDVDDYINQGEFGWREENDAQTVTLIADISPQTTFILNETPLSEQQTITPIDNSEWHRLEAEVPNNQETLWWIYGMNHNIRVHQPHHWQDAIRQTLKQQNAFYLPDDT